MTRAVLMPFHLYTQFGKSFYEPILDFQLQTLKKYENEYDKLYLIDSNWDIDSKKIVLPETSKWAVIKINPHIRYYDAYKEVLPQIKEDYILFLDNDFVIYKPNIIDDAFSFLSEGYNVVSIYDTIGTYKTDKLNGKNKFCPYFFCTKKNLLMHFLEYDWGPDMPMYETFGLLTKKMLEYGVKPMEFEEDKTNIHFDGTKDGEKGKNLGYYHIRAGSTPAYLLATKEYGNKDTYTEYITNQPTQEILRHYAWYDYMNSKTYEGLWKLSERGMIFLLMLNDLKINLEQWEEYMKKFIRYHGL